MKMSEIQRMAETLRIHQSDLPDDEAVKIASEQMGIRLDRVYQEMEMDDPYVDTHEDPGSYPQMVQLHSHSFYEVLYICGGTVQYLIGTERYRLQPGDVVLVPPGISHRPLPSEDASTLYRRYVLWLSTDFVRLIAPFFPREGFSCPSLLRTAGTKWNTLGARFRAGIREAERKKPGWQAALYANTVELLVQFYRVVLNEHSHAPASEKPELLDQILAYVEENLNSKITLTETARRFYVSESTISSLFRREMGVSFHRCITQRRLITAKNLILSGIAMDAVAETAGFNDYSAFYRAFRGEFGISPRQFRDQQRKNE